jgi:hypothetical protein
VDHVDLDCPTLLTAIVFRRLHPIDGSAFDCDILDMIAALKKKYADKP